MDDIRGRTLGDVLSDPLLSPVARNAIRKKDLTKEPVWTMTLDQLKAAQWGGDVALGLTRLLRAAKSGHWCFPLYPGDEDPERAEVTLTWLPSDDPAADTRPYLFIVPGGGFVNVWSLTEGWPIAAHFNARGYHAFVLSYRVAERLAIPHAMEDMAQAIRFIRDRADLFPVRWDRYITCGFSAGGYLIGLWATRQYGAASFSLPQPLAMLPVYPVTSWRLCMEREGFKPMPSAWLLGCSMEEALASAYELPEHVEGFPPCAIFLAAQDDLVPSEHSLVLKRALDAKGIPCRL